MSVYKIAVIPGDGIGKEVVSAGVEVLEAIAEWQDDLQLDFSHFDWGTDRYKKTGLLMPQDGADQLKS